MYDVYVYVSECVSECVSLCIRLRLNWTLIGRRPPLIELVLLDAGLTSSLSKIDRSNFIELFRAVAFGEGWEAGQTTYVYIETFFL